MDVFVIGATGYLGRGAVRALLDRGHTVRGLARNEKGREWLWAAGSTPVEGDVSRPETLRDLAVAGDAVIYAVQYDDHANAVVAETRALETLAAALDGTGKALLYTSGVWYYGATGDGIADEETPANPPPTVVMRPRLERIVLDSAAHGVRAIVLRPADVFGAAGGLPMFFVQSARESGAARTFGNGSNRWPVVHVDDLGQLYALALEKASPGDVYNANDETAFTQREIAQAASRGAGRDGATTVWNLDEAAAAMGEWIRSLALDQRITSARARARLGWVPKASTIVEDLERGSYLRAVAT